MLTIQRKTSFSGITFSFMLDGKLLAPHVSGLLLSQAAAKCYGSGIPVLIEFVDGKRQKDNAIFRSVIRNDAMGNSESFVDICIISEYGSAFAELPLIALRDKRDRNNKAVKTVFVENETKLINFLIEQRDVIERQSLYEFLCDSELRNVRHVMRFLGLPIKGGEEIEDHADSIIEVDRAVWHTQFEEYGCAFSAETSLPAMAIDAITFMEHKLHDDSSLSFDDDEEELDFENESETFTTDFDGDEIEETILGEQHGE